MKSCQSVLFFVLPAVSLLLFGCPPETYAGAWTLKRGQLSVKSTLLYQNTSERYYSANTPCPLGESCTRSGQRVSFPFDGESRLTALFFDVNYGILDRLQLGLQIPYFDIQFTDIPDPTRPGTSEIGDTRFGAKYLVFKAPFVTAVEVQAKAPTGFFNRDAEIVPVGDGQWDLDVSLQFGKSLWPIRGYVNLEAGHRTRFAPDLDKANVQPGDELFWSAEAGYTFLPEKFGAKGALSGLSGGKFKALQADGGFEIADSEREAVNLEVGLWWRWQRALSVEASVTKSLSGKNFPAGEVFGIGVAYLFSF